MTHRMNTRAYLALTLGSLLAVAGPVAAHVRLVSPNGGESLVAGSIVTITWTVQIRHSLQNWDLWYSATGPTGPWIVIEMNLPPGSGLPGSIHEYEWVVPAVMTDQGRIRVRMDNVGTNYEDISDGNFSIVACPCACDFDTSTGVGVCDLIDFTTFAGLFATGDPCACDIDTSTGVGVCDLIDFTTFAGQFAGGCP